MAQYVRAEVGAEFERMMTARYGVVWVPRADGHGREIAGTPAKAMDTFSSRRTTDSAEAGRRVAPLPADR